MHGRSFAVWILWSLGAVTSSTACVGEVPRGAGGGSEPAHGGGQSAEVALLLAPYRPDDAQSDGLFRFTAGYEVEAFESTNVKEFLLVPFVGACIHVPPPPANQIVYVKVEKGFDVSDTFAPVTVTGTIKTDLAITGLADAAYTMEATSVEPRTE